MGLVLRVVIYGLWGRMGVSIMTNILGIIKGFMAAIPKKDVPANL